MSLRILQISSARDFGGGERHLVELCRELTKRGCAVHLAHRPGAGWVQKLALQKHQLPLRNALDVQSVQQLARVARTAQIDVIHAHVARDYPLATGAAWMCPGVKLVFTRHVMFPLKRWHRLTLGRTDGVIAVSSAVARQLHAQRLAQPEKISVIHNGIDLACFTGNLTDAPRAAWQEQMELRPAQFWVGFLGDLNPRKGPDDFLHIAAQIAAQRSDVAFIVAGPDTSPHGTDRPRLEQLAQELGLQGRVGFLGALAETAPFYHALEIFVSASHSESFGLAIAEAMACGVPVIATATDGACEIIQDRVTGRLVPIAQPQILAQNINALLADAAMRATLARQARADVTARFSLQKMADATLSLYQKL